MKPHFLKIGNISIWFITLLIVLSCQNPTLQKISFQGKALGTYYSIHVYHTDSSKEFQSQLQAGVDSLLNAFNKVASIYDTASIISRINRNEPYELNKMFLDIFEKSMQISNESGGAFDITVGPLVNAWGFGFADSIHITQTIIDSLLQFVGYEKVRYDGTGIVKDDPRIMLDMNGIAKGYAVDITARFLESKGISSYIVEIGGEIRVGNEKPDGNLWIVAIEKPAASADAPQQEDRRIYLKNTSVATSGTYRRFYEKDGVKYSHTIDPKTGRPVTHSMLSATVIAPECVVADALATACMVLGVDEAIKLCESLPDVEGYFIIGEKQHKYSVRYTNGFKKFMKN